MPPREPGETGEGSITDLDQRRETPAGRRAVSNAATDPLHRSPSSNRWSAGLPPLRHPPHWTLYDVEHAKRPERMTMTTPDTSGDCTEVACDHSSDRYPGSRRRHGVVLW
jgi:hypothetical protein